MCIVPAKIKTFLTLRSFLIYSLVDSVIFQLFDSIFFSIFVVLCLCLFNFVCNVVDAFAFSEIRKDEERNEDRDGDREREAYTHEYSMLNRGKSSIRYLKSLQLKYWSFKVQY